MDDPLTPTASQTTAASSVDAIAAPDAGPTAINPASLRRGKKVVLLFSGIFYASFALWCAFLLIALPSPTGEWRSIQSIGTISSLAGVLAFVGAGLFALKRISSSKASIATRRRSLLKTILVLLPGVLLGAATPILISREPSLPLDIIEPRDTADFVAPIAVTLSAERTATILRNLGYRAIKYQWDTDGDGKMNDETVEPKTTVVYERLGVYLPAVRVQLEGGGYRRIVRRVSIPRAVFSVTPARPIVERVTKFSVAGLLTDTKSLKQVQWDFGDGNPPVIINAPDTAYTYYAVGDYNVTAVLQMQNQSQITYKRVVAVQEPPPLPFPITLSTEPKTLIGPVPFGVLLRLETAVPLKEVAWSFGDGKEDRGANLLRTSHIFESPGIYPTVVRARSQDGKLAEITTIVRATEVLSLQNLQFDGQPGVQNGKIVGEVPVEVRLTPKTATPLVQFNWEIPDNLDMQADGKTLMGIFRKEGKYTVTLMAEGAGGMSMRMPIAIEVKPPSAEPTIILTPDGGTAPLAVTFDASQSFIPPGETVAGFKWLFGDERQGNSREPQLGAARVEHTYQEPGAYIISLSIVLISGREFTSRRTIVVRKPDLSACLTASRLRVQAGKGVEFDSSCSTGEITSLLWDVRRDDDPKIVQAQSSDQSYVYVFNEEGEYTVTLSLKDSYGNQDKKTVSIYVAPAP